MKLTQCIFAVLMLTFAMPPPSTSAQVPVDQETDLPGVTARLLLASAAPIAVLVNSVRIFLLCLVAEIYGEKSAVGWFHDVSGLLLFVMAFLALEGVVKLLQSTGHPAEARA